MHNLQVPIPRQDVSAPQKRRISSLFTERFCSSLARVDANTQFIARTYGANFRPFPKSAAAGSWWRALTPAWERTTAAAWERTVTQWCVDEWWAWAKWLQLGRPSRSIWQPIPAAWKEVKSWIGVELREDYLDRTLCTPSTASERTVIKLCDGSVRLFLGRYVLRRGWRCGCTYGTGTYCLSSVVSALIDRSRGLRRDHNL